MLSTFISAAIVLLCYAGALTGWTFVWAVLLESVKYAICNAMLVQTIAWSWETVKATTIITLMAEIFLVGMNVKIKHHTILTYAILFIVSILITFVTNNVQVTLQSIVMCAILLCTFSAIARLWHLAGELLSERKIKSTLASINIMENEIKEAIDFLRKTYEDMATVELIKTSYTELHSTVAFFIEHTRKNKEEKNETQN